MFHRRAQNQRSTFVCIATLLFTSIFGLMAPTPHGKRNSPKESLVASYRVQQYGSLPLGFEPNTHQFNREFEFLARGANHTLLLKPDTAALKMSMGANAAMVELRFRGANARAEMRGLEKLPGEANYFTGSQENWITHVPMFGKVYVKGLYPGVDLTYYGNPGRLEYDFIVKPGATPDGIDFEFEGVSGVRLADGDLVMSIGKGEIRQKKPAVYQEIDGAKRVVDARYVLRDGAGIGFAVGAYDHRLPLVIDPQLIYSLYMFFEHGLGVATDPAGDAYICGYTPDAFEPDKTDDAFVTKLNPAGTAVIYRNSFGAPAAPDEANAIAVDPLGNAYVVGHTGASSPFGGFPTVNPIEPLQPTMHYVGFLTKFDPNGAMLYSTVLGGSGIDSATGIAVDAMGDMFVAGYTSSRDFPTSHPLQPALNGPSDAFVTALNAQGNAFIFSTYVGGSGDDAASGIAVDAMGYSYVSGSTASADFPTEDAIVPAAAGGGFAFKLNPAGSAFQYSTYLSEGGANGIAVDPARNAYVTGATGNPSDAYVKKIDPTGSAFVYSAHIGGSSNDVGNGVAVDAFGNAYVTGFTDSSDFPQLASLETFVARSRDAFLTKLSTTGAIVYSTLLAGNERSPGAGPGAYNSGQAVASDADGNVYVAGVTSASNFPRTSSPVNIAWVASITDAAAFLVKLTNDAPSAAIKLIQSNANQETAEESVSASFPSANSPGNLIIAFVRMSTTFQTVNVTDTAGNAYVDAVSQGQTADGHQVHIFYAKNIAGGANTVTASFSATINHSWLAVYEYSGLSTTNPIDQVARAQGSDNSPFSGLITTTSANELEFAATGLPASYTGSVSPGPGYTMQLQDTGTSRAANEAALLNAASNQYAGRFNLSSATNWTIVVATFVAKAPLHISTQTLPDGSLNSPYHAQLVADGGTSPYSWSAVLSDSLGNPFFPPGLTLDSSTGAISGSPTRPGQYTFTASVTDAASHTSHRFFNLLVPTPPALGIVQANSIEGTAVGSVSVPFNSNNTAGNLIVAFVRMSTTWESVTVTDSAGNVYTDAASQLQTVDDHQVHVFYAKNVAGGANTVTARFSSTNNHPWLAIFEYAGLNKTNPLDQTGHAQGAGTPTNSGSITTSGPGSGILFLASGLPASYTGTVTWFGGPPQLQDTGRSRAAAMTFLSNQGGQYAAQFDLNPGTNWTAVIVAFRQ